MINLQNPNFFLENLKYDELMAVWSKLAKIREFENQIKVRYSKNLMKTPIHLGIGQEAVAVGVLNGKKAGDHVYSHHRSHNSYIASGGDLKILAKELHGKTGGTSNGKGGSVHIVDQDSGFMGSTAILGQAVSVATGAALGLKLAKSKNCVFVFFGDAALEEGIVWESFNFASLYKLPIFYVCENNFLSTESVLKNRKPLNTSFTEKVRSFGLHTDYIFGQNVFEVIAKSRELIEIIRSECKPVFLECITYRFLEHVGPDYDYEKNRTFRGRNEQKINEMFDPIRIVEEILTSIFNIDAIKIQAKRKVILEDVISAFDEAEHSDFPNAQDLFSNVD